MKALLKRLAQGLLSPQRLEQLRQRRRLRGLGLRPVRFGDLRRTTPIGKDFGYERGEPIDRYYIHKFLAQNSDAIQGRVLEIGNREYSRRFGGDQVTQSDVLHAVAGNSEATIVGDLVTGEGVPEGVFDCLILTQTIHVIYRFQDALATAHRALNRAASTSPPFPASPK
ncbi:MAG: hypothetical protein ACR2NX_13305 [Chthoniobacterales bacterium]